MKRLIKQSSLSYLFSWLLVVSPTVYLMQAPVSGSELCTVSITPTNDSFGPSGGAGSVEVVAADHCSWAVVSSCGWIVVTSALSGTGPETLSFEVGPYSGPTIRTGTLDIEGETFTLTQGANELSDVHYLPFYQGEGSEFTGFAVSSYSDEPTAVQLTAFGTDGIPLPFSENPSSFELPGRGQLAKLGYQLFGVDAMSPQSAWVQLASDNCPLSSFFLVGSSSQLDGAVAFTGQSKKLYFSRVLEGPASFRGLGATTYLSIVNPNDQEITFEASLWTTDTTSPSSLEKETHHLTSRSIPGKGFIFTTASQLFDLDGSVVQGHVLVEVVSGNGAVGFELIKLHHLSTLMGLNATFGNPGFESYSAQLAVGSSIFTSLKLINTDQSVREVSLQAVANDGSSLADPVDLVLAPGKSFEKDINQVFGLSIDGLTVGSLRLSADGPGIVGDILFGDPLTGYYAAALPLQTKTFMEGIFSQVVNQADFFTGLALYNPGGETALVSIEVFSSTGQRTGYTTLHLAPEARISRQLVELVPSTAGQTGGFIAIRSNVGLVGQSLFGDFNFTVLSAVPPNMSQSLPPLVQSPYAEWENGPPSDPAYFPIGVWLQSPANAPNFQEIGINTYVGLWQGPTQAQLTELENHGMPVISSQNAIGLTSPRNHLIQAWRQWDEPDNAQPDGQGGYGPCVSPAELLEVFQRLQTNDDTRPVFLNFGQGVANIHWKGRGSCTGDTGYYPAASEAADIVSFDIYPVTHSDPKIRGNLEFVAQGVSNLVEWSGGEKIVWNFIETTHIKDPSKRPTVDEIRAEVWMSIIHGSMGILYFVHEWEPSFREDAIFRYPEIVQGVKEINAQISSLAPVLNSPTLDGKAEGSSTTPIALMTKQYGQSIYLFAVAMRDTPTTATFAISEVQEAAVEVLGESRSLTLGNGLFQDGFEGYGVHLYKITEH